MVYRRGFDWAKGLRQDDHERLRRVATKALDDLRLDALLQQAGPALEAIQKGAAIPRCDWEREILTDDDLNKDHLEVSSTLDVIRIACLSARRPRDRAEAGWRWMMCSPAWRWPIASERAGS